MAIQFETTIPHGDGSLTIKSDSYTDLHIAASRIGELQRDARLLRSKGVKSIILHYHESKDFKYYGCGNAEAYEQVCFGQLVEGGDIAFFPKGEEGYFKPDPNYKAGQQSQRPQQDQQREKPPAQSYEEDNLRPDDDLPF